LVFNNKWFILLVAIILLCFVIYAMSTRILHIVFSDPLIDDNGRLPDRINPVESISQFVLLGIVIVMCFYQPPFLADMINQSFALLPKWLL